MQSVSKRTDDEVQDNAPRGALFFVRLGQFASAAINPTGLSARSACFKL